MRASGLTRLLELRTEESERGETAEVVEPARSNASRNETGRHYMPAIGYVNKLDDGSYRGTLRTLSISAALKIMPNKDKNPDSDQPDFRVYANGAEIGAAWFRKNKDNGEYVSVSISAPEFGPRRLFANLGRAAGSESDDEFAVIWNPTE